MLRRETLPTGASDPQGHQRKGERGPEKPLAPKTTCAPPGSDRGELAAATPGPGERRQGSAGLRTLLSGWESGSRRPALEDRGKALNTEPWLARAASRASILMGSAAASEEEEPLSAPPETAEEKRRSSLSPEGPGRLKRAADGRRRLRFSPIFLLKTKITRKTSGKGTAPPVSARDGLVAAPGIPPGRGSGWRYRSRPPAVYPCGGTAGPEPPAGAGRG